MDQATQNFLDILPQTKGAKAAADWFSQTGLPNRRLENYHYSDIRKAFDNIPQIEEAGEIAQLNHDIILCFKADEYEIIGEMVGVNIIENGEIETNLTRTNIITSGLADEIINIEVQENTKVNIGIYRYAGARFAINIKAQKSSQIEIFEALSSKNGLSSFGFDYEGEDNASLIYSRFIDAGLGVDIYFGGISTSTNGTIVLNNLSLGGKLSRQEFFISLIGENADCKVNGAYLLKNAHNDFTIELNHTVPHCTSTEKFKGAVGDAGNGAFQGKIGVWKDAQKTSAQMGHHALILSENAKINAKPSLEIYADDVECSHGNTFGALDEKALFYMRARGLSEASAKNMLIHAFIEEAFEDVDNQEVKDFYLAQTSLGLDGLL